MYRYAAFISYNHADSATARWLHRRLERYRVPKALREVGFYNPTPSSIGRIFRDREEVAAGSPLRAEIETALDQSRVLLVLCSPHAAASRYVDMEIRYFRQLGGDRRVVPVILEGDPAQSFPQALLESDELIAADLRLGKDGRDVGFLKVVAGLLGVGVDALIQRDRVAQRRRFQLLAAAALAFAVLAVASVLLAMSAMGNAQLARERQRSAESATHRALVSEHRARVSETQARRNEALAAERLDRNIALQDLASNATCDRDCEQAVASFMAGNPARAAAMLARNPHPELQRVARVWSRYGTPFSASQAREALRSDVFNYEGTTYLRMADGTFRALRSPSFTAWDRDTGLVAEHVDDKIRFSGRGIDFAMDGRQTVVASVNDLCGSGWYLVKHDLLGMLCMTGLHGLETIVNPRLRRVGWTRDPGQFGEPGEARPPFPPGVPRSCQARPLPYYGGSGSCFGARRTPDAPRLTHPPDRSEAALWRRQLAVPRFSQDCLVLSPLASATVYDDDEWRESDRSGCDNLTANVPRTTPLQEFAEDVHEVFKPTSTMTLAEADTRGDRTDPDRILGVKPPRLSAWLEGRTPVWFEDQRDDGNGTATDMYYNFLCTPQKTWRCFLIDGWASQLASVTDDGRFALYYEQSVTSKVLLLDTQSQRLWRIVGAFPSRFTLSAVRGRGVDILQDLSHVIHVDVSATGVTGLASHPVTVGAAMDCQGGIIAAWTAAGALILCKNGTTALLSRDGFAPIWHGHVPMIATPSGRAPDWRLTVLGGEIAVFTSGATLVGVDIASGIRLSHAMVFDGAISAIRGDSDGRLYVRAGKRWFVRSMFDALPAAGQVESITGYSARPPYARLPPT